MSTQNETPVWEEFHRESWRIFLRKYKTYKKKGGASLMRNLIEDGVTMLLELKCPNLDIAEIDDEELVDVINLIWAPKTVVHALTRLRTVKMSGSDFPALAKFCVDFHHELKTFPADVKPSGKQSVRAFQEQLKPAFLKRLVIAQEFDVIGEAVSYAMETAEGIEQYSAPEPTQAETKDDKKAKQDNSGRARNRQSNQGVKPRQELDKLDKPIECFNCGKLGHKSPDCRSPKKERPGRAVRKIETDKDQDDEDEAPTPICNVISKKNDGRRFNARIYGETQEGNVTVLLDTGADLNVVHPDIVAQFESTGIVVIRSPVTYKTASGEGHAGHQVTLDVEVSKGLLMPVRIRTTFAVADCGENMILGWPWLEEHSLTRLLVQDEPEDSSTGIILEEVEEGTKARETFWDDEELHQQTQEILDDFPELFGPIGTAADVPEFGIHILPDRELPRVKPRRISTEQRDEIRRQVEELVRLGVVRPSTSPYSSPIVLQRKKDGSQRLCIDYRILNAATKDMALPMPNGKEVLHRMQGSKYFGKGDLTKGYHQLGMHKDSIEYTAFATLDGLFEWLRMPFGLKNPSGFFQCTMERTLAGIKNCEVFVDDIIIHGPTKDEYLQTLRQVLERLQEKGFRLNRDKCSFGLKTVEYIGHILSEDGITLSESRKEAVKKIPPPTTVKELRSFLGFVNYFRDFVPDMARISKPLYALTKKKAKFIWGQPQQEAFSLLRQATADCCRLTFPDPEATLMIRTDASNLGIGAHLSQISQSGHESTIAFFSQAFNETQSRWSTIEQEAYGIYAAIQHWDHFVNGKRFVVETDHRNLVYIHKCKAQKIIRWRIQLQDYDFIIKHVAGTDNVVADFLSRFPANNDDEGKAIKMLSATDDQDIMEIVDIDVQDLPGPMDATDTADEMDIARSQTSSPELALPQPQADDHIEVPMYPICWNTDAAAGADDNDSDFEFEIDLGFPLASTTDAPTGDATPNVAVLATQPTAAPAIDGQVATAFRQIHNSLVGHLGVDASVRRLKEQGITCNNLRAQVQTLMTSCAVCQKIRMGQGSVVAAIKTTAVEQPFTHLMWDTIGPIQEDPNGHKYVLVAMDRFTRFIELVPTRTVSAQDAAAALLQIVGRYGTFATVHSDRGRQFDSAVVKQLCTLMGMTQSFGPPYRPEAQGTVERSNRETIKHLRAMMVAVADTAAWSDYLPLVQRIYNSLPNRSTGVAPARLLYGDAVNIDRSLLTPPAPTGPTVTYTKYLADLLTAQRRLVDASAAHQQTVVQHALKAAPPDPTTYDVGSLVLVNPAVRPARAKLQPRWLGPMAIVSRQSDTYVCEDLNTGHHKTVHVGRLKAYVEDPTIPAPDAALWDNEVALVDSIVAHRAARTKAKWMFKVRWLDYDADGDTWEPLRNVRETTAFAHYVRDHQLAPFPPSAFPLDANG